MFDQSLEIRDEAGRDTRRLAPGQVGGTRRHALARSGTLRHAPPRVSSAAATSLSTNTFCLQFFRISVKLA